METLAEYYFVLTPEFLTENLKKEAFNIYNRQVQKGQICLSGNVNK